MADPQLVRSYLERLVQSLAPAEYTTPRLTNLVGDLAFYISRPRSPETAQSGFAYPSRLLPDILEDYKTLFLRAGRTAAWRDFQIVIDALITGLLSDQHRYLEQLLRLAPAELATIPESARYLASFSPHPGPPAGATMGELIAQHYFTRDEALLVSCLRHVLVGQDTSILRFLKDRSGVEIPDDVNTSYTQLLAEIVEPALLWQNLRAFLATRQGAKHSPIQTAFLSFVETYLVGYADHIETIFRTPPSSLLILLDSLEAQIHHLRFLAHLKERFGELGGYEFLLEIYKVSRFGDDRVSDLLQRLFRETAAPYFQYLEHWIVKGELVDENNEFFVSFDKDAYHINDIIQYHPQRLPPFIKLDAEVFVQMFQLGKTLVFLEKYCKELDWVNDFALRYYLFVFTAHKGVQTMHANTLQAMVNAQYNEAIRHFLLVAQSRFLLYLHLLSMKHIMLMQAGDFIDTIRTRGAVMFREPAVALTSGRLSELLADSIALSSLRALPQNYRRRIDAKILDLSHGTTGWDVFTLSYHVPEPPLDALLNYKDQNTQYLRLFNFLWNLKRYQYLVQENFLQFQNYHRCDFRFVKQKLRAAFGGLGRLAERRIQWLSRALRCVSLVRHKIATMINTILNFVLFDLIENSFSVHIVRKLFKNHGLNVPELRKGASGEAARLSILNSAFLRERNAQSLTGGLQMAETVETNLADLTIDDLTSTHAAYLRSVSDCKLLREDVRGHHSGKSFVNQIFELLEIAFVYLCNSEEFGAVLTNYLNLLRVESGSDELEENWGVLRQRLASTTKTILEDIYEVKFQLWRKTFVLDMRAEVDLREFSKMI